MKKWILAVFSTAVLLSAYASAHHSFAPYDVYNDPIEFAGVVESFEFIRPHPVMKLKGADGCLWTLGVAQRWWNRAELPEDALKAGDELIVIGWPARDSSPELLLAGFEIKGSERIVFQTRATGNSNPPENEVTITWPVCTD